MISKKRGWARSHIPRLGEEALEDGGALFSAPPGFRPQDVADTAGREEVGGQNLPNRFLSSENELSGVVARALSLEAF